MRIAELLSLFNRAILLAVFDNLRPLRVHREGFRVSDDDQQRFGARHQHIKPLLAVQETDRFRVRSNSRHDDDSLLLPLEDLYGPDLNSTPAHSIASALDHLPLLSIGRNDADVLLLQRTG